MSSQQLKRSICCTVGKDLAKIRGRDHEMWQSTIFVPNPSQSTLHILIQIKILCFLVRLLTPPLCWGSLESFYMSRLRDDTFSEDPPTRFFTPGFLYWISDLVSLLFEFRIKFPYMYTCICRFRRTKYHLVFRVATSLMGKNLDSLLPLITGNRFPKYKTWITSFEKVRNSFEACQIGTTEAVWWKKRNHKGLSL
jgi:hypothetical protein